MVPTSSLELLPAADDIAAAKVAKLGLVLLERSESLETALAGSSSGFSDGTYPVSYAASGSHT